MRTVILAAFSLTLAHPALAQSPCRIQGAWELVSGTADGEAYPARWRQLKIITETHFAFVRESEDRGVKELKTAADSLQAFRTMFSGGGTYTLQGTTYTENLEYFADPTYLGMSLPFTCRTEGDRFYQSGTYPILEDGQPVREVQLEEVWRRIG